MLVNELNVNAKGGTELMAERLYSTFPNLDDCQIWFSRFRVDQYDETKRQFLYLHDLAEDPEAAIALDPEATWQFEKIIFVSDWQLQTYLMRFPHLQTMMDKLVVIHNAIEPFNNVISVNGSLSKFTQPFTEENPLILGYWSTPHRGLDILLAAVEAIQESGAAPIPFELHAFSSFKLYGWEQRDEPFQPLFEQAKRVGIYHGTQSNETIREFAQRAHVLAYPCTWQETSCLVLIEALCAGMLPLVPSYGAIPETTLGRIRTFPFIADREQYAREFVGHLLAVMDLLRADLPRVSLGQQLNAVAKDTNDFYNWERRIPLWKEVLGK